MLRRTLCSDILQTALLVVGRDPVFIELLDRWTVGPAQSWFPSPWLSVHWKSSSWSKVVCYMRDKLEVASRKINNSDDSLVEWWDGKLSGFFSIVIF